jgi:Phosphotransferase enzyme family
VSGTDASIDPELLAFARQLASVAGRAVPIALTRLAGGKNNQVFRADMGQSEPLVLKRYFSDKRDTRDRLAAEWGFLQHAWSRGVRTIPQPLASDKAAQIGLYSFVPGRKLCAAELDAAQVDAAVDFVLAVNAAPRDPMVLAPGSEACFSLAQHLETVERRVARLSQLDPEAPHTEAAQRFVAGTLLPKWAAARARIVRAADAAGLSLDRVLAAEECCLSPSDFGFHNALADDAGRLSFLDFEYAGRDDPAKLVSDFFCQPEIPVPLEFHARFVARLADGLGLDQAGRVRCNILLDAYRIKWTCIILNDFLPLGAARRAFADAGQWAERCAAQLAKAAANVAGMAT